MRSELLAISAFLVLLSTACSDGSANGKAAPRDIGSAPAPSVPVEELYKVASDSAILAAARVLMLADSNVAVVTVDSMGQPRVRTTKAFVSDVSPGDPANGVTVWIMTRLTTRKVDQMRRHPQVTLYFNSDDRVEYATIMGTAVIHTDASNPEAKKFYENGYAEFFWPDFPNDFVMIEVKPRWLEYLGPSIAAHPQTWRPQAVVFDTAISAR
jgi:general stress protein 26